jgi:hypothetical protein
MSVDQELAQAKCGTTDGGILAFQTKPGLWWGCPLALWTLHTGVPLRRLMQGAQGHSSGLPIIEALTRCFLPPFLLDEFLAF